MYGTYAMYPWMNTFLFFDGVKPRGDMLLQQGLYDVF